MTASEPIVFWGAGAIGGTIGGHLLRAGRNVVFVDANADHVAAINADGLHVAAPEGSFKVRARAFMPDEVTFRIGTVFLSVKGPATTAALNRIGPLLAEAGGLVISLQNGLAACTIAERFGNDRVLACLVNIGAEYVSPGRVMLGNRGALVVGNLKGKSSLSVDAVQNILCDFDSRVIATKNIMGYIWAKLAFTALLLGQTLSNVPTERFLDDPAYRPRIKAMVGEVAKVAHIAGIRLETFQAFDAAVFAAGADDAMDKSISAYADSRRGSSKSHSGIWTDIVRRRRPTEVGYLLGPVIERARATKLDLPHLTQALAILSDVESGRILLDHDLL